MTQFRAWLSLRIWYLSALVYPSSGKWRLEITKRADGAIVTVAYPADK